MRVLLVGNGGREHALLAALRRSPSVSEILATRPNAGMAPHCTAVDVGSADVGGLVATAIARGVDLVVVGPEVPLVLGLADVLKDRGIPVLGPTAAAARIEGSKAFSKQLMQEAGVPTAAFATFTRAHEAEAYLRQTGRPLVVKADGLAAGKGVVVPGSLAEAIDAVPGLLALGGTIVVEERLTGPEVSVIALVDGLTVRTLPPARDHKRAFDGDRGPNTGGMGAYSPVADVDAALLEAIHTTIVEPAARALVARGAPFQGFLYAGVMLTPDGPKALEFNARMGDPECQVLLPRLLGDVGETFYAAATGALSGVDVRVDPRAAVCVVVASAGYPGTVTTGDPIGGLEQAEDLPDVHVFHAGTAVRDGQIVTAGGRILGVMALGESRDAARDKAYTAVGSLRIAGAHYRRDIGR